MATESNIKYTISTDITVAQKKISELTENIKALHNIINSKDKVLNINTRESIKEVRALTVELNRLKKNIGEIKAGKDAISFTGVQQRLTEMNRRIETFNSQLVKARNNVKELGNIGNNESKYLANEGHFDSMINKADKFINRLNEMRNSYGKLISAAKELRNNSIPSLPSLGVGAVGSRGEYTKSTPLLNDYKAQIRALRAESELNFTNNFKTDRNKYLENQTRIHQQYRQIQKDIDEINTFSNKAIGITEIWGDHLDKVGSRLNYIATRTIAQWGLDRVNGVMDIFESIDSGMAGMAQVMPHIDMSKVIQELQGSNKSFDESVSHVNVYRKALTDITTDDLAQHLHKATTSNDAFNSSLEEMQKKILEIGVTYGATSNDVIESAKLWGRAYKDNLTVLTLTEAATKLAVADAFDIVTANKALESTIMQWNYTIHDATDAMVVSNRIIDSWTALSHNYTVSAQTLVEANRRMAQSAREVGVDFDTAQAMIAVMARKTQADGGEIGNSLKSMFGSIHSDKAVKELEKFGVQVYKIGANGQKEFRKADDVLIDLMVHAEGSRKNLEEMLKAISGGKWQWNKVSAMLDYKEFITALRESKSAYGFTDEQVGMQLDTIGKKLQGIKTAWQELITSQTGGGKVIKEVLDLTLSFMKTLNEADATFIKLSLAAVTYIAAYKTFGVTSTTIAQRIVGFMDKIFSLGGIISKQTAEQIALKQKELATEEQLVAATNAKAAAESKATAAAAAGGVTSKAAPLAAAGETAAMGASVGRLAAGINYATLAVVGLTLAYEGYRSILRSGIDDTNKEVQSHKDLANVYAEQQKRLEDAPNTIEQMTNAYEALQARREEIANSDMDAEEKQKALKKLDEEMIDTKGVLIDAIGQERTEALLAADDKAAAIEHEKELTQQKKQEYIEAYKKEIELVQKASKTLNENTRKDIEALSKKGLSFIDLINIIIKYLDAIDAVKTAWAKLNQFIWEKREDHWNEMSKNYEAEGDTKMAEYYRQMAQKAHEGAQDQQNEIDRIKAEAILAAKHQQDMINNLASMGKGDSDNPSGYTRSEVDSDDDDGSGKKKGSKAKQQRLEEDNSTDARIVANILLKKGFSREQVSGIIGNLIAESGSPGSESLNTSATNGNHWGIAQWDSPRWNNLIAFAKTRGFDPYDIRTQGEFIAYELLNGEEKENNATAINKARDLQNTPEAYAHTYNQYWERSGVDSWQRQQNARAFDMAFFDGHGYTGKTREESPEEKLSKLYQGIFQKSDKEIQLALQGIQNTYDIKNKDIQRKEKLSGSSTDTMNEKVEIETKRLNDLTAVQVKFKDALNEILKTLSDADKNEIKGVIGMSVDDFVKQDSIEQSKIINKLSDDGNKLMNIRLSAIQKVTATNEKYVESLKDVNLELKEATRNRDEFIMKEAEELTSYHRNLAETETTNVLMNDDKKQEIMQPILKDEEKNARVRYAYALQNKDIYSPDKIRELEINWLKAQKAATQYADTLANDVKKQTHDVVHSILFEGKSLRDVWKDLWKQLAEEALKRLFQIQNGSQGMFGWLSSLLGGGRNKFGGNIMGAILGASSPASSALSFTSYTPNFSSFIGHADGGIFDKEHIARISENNKEEVVVPTTGNKERNLKLLSYAAAKLGYSPRGVSPNISSKSIEGSKKISNQSSQTLSYMAKMNEMNQTMLNILGNMANNQSEGGAYMAQPVVLKQTMTDSEFVRQFSKLQRLGKLRGGQS